MVTPNYSADSQDICVPRRFLRRTLRFRRGEDWLICQFHQLCNGQTRSFLCNPEKVLRVLILNKPINRLHLSCRLDLHTPFWRNTICLLCCRFHGVFLNVGLDKLQSLPLVFFSIQRRSKNSCRIDWWRQQTCDWRFFHNVPLYFEKTKMQRRRWPNSSRPAMWNLYVIIHKKHHIARRIVLYYYNVQKR